MNHFSKLNKLLDAGEAVISIVAPVRERQNVLKFLYNTLTDHFRLSLYLWNLGEPEHFRRIECEASSREQVVLVDGFEVEAAEVTSGSGAIAALKFFQNSNTNGVFILENIPSCMQEREGVILRQLLINISSDITARKTSKFLILLVTDEVELPVSLSGLIESLELPYPDVSEIENLISTYLPTLIGATVSVDLIQSLATATTGLHTEDIKAGLRQAVLNNDGVFGSDVSLVRSLLDYKINRFRSFNLNFVPEPDVYDFGGLDNLRCFIQDAKLDFQTDARTANIPLPKGCLLVGPPGTGKTLAANVLARELGFPLVSIDTGAVVAGGVMYLKRLLNRVEACAPVVLYFDELDKLFTATTVSGEDSGSRHILGILLTWLQDKRSAVFVVATLNRLDVLPPELTRVGRFDEIFYVGFPNAFERKQIISLHAARFDERYRDGGDTRSVKPPAYRLTQQEWKILLNKTVNCTGAELARMVEKAARIAQRQASGLSLFHSGKPMVIDLPILLQQREAIVPLYVRDTDRILAIENRARGFAQPASSPDCSEYSPPIRSYWEENIGV